MPDARVYVGAEDEELVRLHKEKYGREWSKRVVSLIRRDYEGKTEQTEEQPTGITAADRERITRILHAQFDGCYSVGEKAYLAQLKDAGIDPKPGVLRKLKRIADGEPRLYPELVEQLKKELPMIAKIGGLTE